MAAVAFFATLALVFILIVRPQEVWPFLNAFRLLDVFTALAALGVGLDFLRQRQRHAYSPQLPWLAAFIASAYFSSVLTLGRDGFEGGTFTVILAVFMLVVMFGLRTIERLRSLVVLLVVLAIFVSGVAIHQGQMEPQCIEVPTAEEEAALSIGRPDGRACETASSCRKEGEWDVEYTCERVGVLNTISTGRRVRWRGQLGDPNELSVFIGAVFPLIVFLASRQKKKALAHAVAGAAILLGLYTVVLTQSRGGQLVVATVATLYFVARFGVRGLIGAAALVTPVVLLGGRSGEEADSSASERMELLYDGISLLLEKPFVGRGVGQFNELQGHTAHNAYLLAAVELGLPGFFCWTGLAWTSIKIPLTIVRTRLDAAHAESRALASALLMSFAGMSVGIFFLSFTFKQLLFVWLGMPGALYGIVKDEDPTFEVRTGWKDLVGIAVFDVVILVFLYVYTRLKA